MQSFSMIIYMSQPHMSLNYPMISNGEGQATAPTNKLPVCLAVSISDHLTLDKVLLAIAGSKQHWLLSLSTMDELKISF